APAGCAHTLAQSGAGRRLDRYRPAGDDRGRHSLGLCRGTDARRWMPRRSRKFLERQGLRVQGNAAFAVVRAASLPLMSDAATTDSRARAAPSYALDQSVDRAAAAVLAQQHADGHWCYELEADATIPAEYMLLQHYLGEIEDDLQREFAVYLRATQ